MITAIRRFTSPPLVRIGLLFLTYSIAFIIGYPYFGANLGILAFLPPVGAAWLMGTGAGVFAWLLLFPTIPVLLIWVGDFDTDIWSETIWWLGMLVALIVTVFTGYTRNLSTSLKKELAERKKTEAALKHSEQFTRSVTEASLDVIYVYDLSQGRFAFYSRSLPQALGYSDDVLQRGQQSFLKWVIHPDDYPLLLKKPQQYRDAKDGEVIAEEFRLRHASGEWRWFYNRETVFTRSPDGSPLQIVGTSHDITERKHSADILIEKEKLQVALAKEKELAQLKNRFMSVVSHEFRTPLAIIQTSSELLDRYYDRMTPARRQEAVSTIMTHIRYVTDMLRDMTLVAAGEDHLEVKPVPTDLAAFCKRLADETTQAKSHKVSCSCIGDLSHIPVDGKLLQHILNNLLSNAIKYSPDDSPVYLNVCRMGGEVTFAVRDSGIGIPVEDQERIFETFYRAKNVGNISGTGLGLRIVRDYVALHGGTVALDSHPGEGTTVTVRLPVTVTAPIDVLLPQ